MAHQLKEKIKHFLHHDKTATPETTPAASPGYADVEKATSTLTTANVPEAFYPGSKPVVPQEQHPTAPYTSQLGTSVTPVLADRSVDGTPPPEPAVPNDKAAMLGAPPSGDHSKADPAEEPEDLKEELPIVPVSDVKTVHSPATESDVQTKNYPEAGPQDDVQEKDSRGTEPEAEPKNYPEGKSADEPTEQKQEEESRVTDQKAADMKSEGGPAHHLEHSTPEEESEPATEEESSDLPSTDVDSKESPETTGNDLEETPKRQTREETSVE